MSIADRIAAEHEWAPFWCKCGTAVHDANHLTTRKMRDLHTRHVAAVTEAAVRAQVAADIRAAGKAKGDPESDLQLGVRLGVDEAARIAEEGPQP